jgi:iron(III) transport system substrate-binding protein
MASDAGQRILVSGNYEFPAVESAPRSPELQSLGAIRRDPVNVSVYGKNQAQAQAVYDRAGWR